MYIMKGMIDYMYLTVTVYLKTTKEQEAILENYSKMFHSEIERVISRYNENGEVYFIPYRDVADEIAYYSKNQVLHYAEILYQKRRKYPTAKCMNVFSLSPKSFRLESDRLILNFGKHFIFTPLYLKINLHKQQQERIKNNEIIKMDIKKEKRGYYAKFILSVTIPKEKQRISNSMGVDVGMRCPAVCYTSKGKIKFIGNGREIRYFKRIHNAYIKKNKNNYRRLIKFDHKAQRYKNHIDHCISKEVVDFAIAHHIDEVRLENLTNLQKRFKNHEQVCWSYQRLQTYIKYKANLVGMKVTLVDPRFTSKRCPHCGKLNNVKGREYICKCGFKKHRDIVGAMNILIAPEVK